MPTKALLTGEPLIKAITPPDYPFLHAELLKNL